MESDNKCEVASEALLSIEFERNGGGTLTCHGCGHWTFTKVHSEGCLVDKALTALGYSTREARDKAFDEIQVRNRKERYGF
jgi:hypothetical protein